MKHIKRAPQAVIFREYKLALMSYTAFDRATRVEEKRSNREKRYLNPDLITKLANRYLAKMPHKAQGCRFHSFVVYFANLRRLSWVEPTGVEESSAFQDHYPPGQPRKYFRLTRSGKAAVKVAWANPQLALYGRR